MVDKRSQDTQAQLDKDRAYWDAHARRDPLWAVLSHPGADGRRWRLPDFMESGEREVSLLLYDLRQMGLPLRYDSALDFGCGIGRLTQALARRFSRVLGLDISPAMVDLASKINRFPDRASYRVSRHSIIQVIGDEQFELIYSNIVLQHITPEVSRTYLSQFMGALRPGGVLVFQLPSHTASAVGSQPVMMPAAAYRASIELPEDDPRVTFPGAELALTVRLENTSGTDWDQAATGAIRIGNHWLTSAGQMLVQDDGRETIPAVLPSGGSYIGRLVVHAPAHAGRFILEIDAVHEAITWFADQGSSTLRVPIEVADAGERYIPVQQPEPSAAPRAEYGDVALEDMLSADPPENPGEFPMNGIPRDDVVRLIAENGGRILRIEEDDRAKPEWVGYRYYVTR